MLEIVAALARWIQLAATMTILGSCVFLALTNNIRNTAIKPWIKRIERLFPWLGWVALIGLLLILATTAGQVSGDIANALEPEILLGIIKNTQVGQIWLARVLLTLLLLSFVFYLRYASRVRWHYIFCGIFAALPLIAGSLASHSAAEELSVINVLPYALHVIFAGIWIGALPAFLYMLVVYLKNKNKKTDNADILTLTRFSRLALPIMLLIVASGILVADSIFEDRYAALVATPYGWLLMAKTLLLILILMIAAKVRSTLLPQFVNSQTAEQTFTSAGRMNQWIRFEYMLALGLLLIATVLANTTPAKLAPIEEWPLPFRLSFAATWGEPGVMIQFWSGVALFVIACVTIQWGRTKRWNFKRLVFIPLTLMLTSMAVALPPIAIEAYPETYRNTPVPFDAASIANGAALYNENCVVCHGPQGKGNGIMSRTLSTLLPDMLMEPHIEAHTAGDLYHWITYGMKDTDMPGYADKLDEEDRWDLVNFFHALYRGYQARRLTPEIIPNKPLIVAPNFYYATQDGSGGLLQDFRKDKHVLLVLFSWPESKARLEQLNQAYNQLLKQDIVMLAVPIHDLNAEQIADITNKQSFPLVTQGATEISKSYALYRRTLKRADIIGAGSVPEHMEFLIDKHGYLRARSVPSVDEPDWSDIDLLSKQIQMLNQENQLVALPDDYVS